MTIFSTNPKMDTSGIRTNIREIGFDDKPLQGRVVTGGELYLEAVNECDARVTDEASLKKIASLVGQGYSKDRAVDIVAKEAMYSPEGEE